MNRRDALMKKIWRTLEPAGKDLECNFEIDEDSYGLLRAGLINHRTGSAFMVTMNLEDDDRFIVRTLVGALKAAWPHLMERVHWDDLP